MKTINIDIKIKKITTGKCGFFTFWETDNKRLDLPFEPFIIKEPHPLYPYKYHMGEDELLMWKKYNPNITTYSSGLMAQSWEDTMKYEIYQTIVEHKLDQQVENNGKIYTVTFEWIGDPVSHAKLEYK